MRLVLQKLAHPLTLGLGTQDLRGCVLASSHFMKASSVGPLTKGLPKGPQDWRQQPPRPQVLSPSPADLGVGRRQVEASGKRGRGQACRTKGCCFPRSAWGQECGRPGRLTSSSFCLVPGTHDPTEGTTMLSLVPCYCSVHKAALPLTSHQVPPVHPYTSS